VRGARAGYDRAMIATSAEQVKVPLEIRFLDPVSSLKVGREVRIEVRRADGTGERVPVDQLDFSFAPLVWGEVRAGADPGQGIVRVIALAKTADIYDRPRYGLTATYKARGDAALEETGSRFALGMAVPIVDIHFYFRDQDEFEPFEPQEQRTPLAAEDFEVSPPGSAEVILEGKRVRARVLRPGAAPRLTVRFPNGERATIELDMTRAGRTGPIAMTPGTDAAGAVAQDVNTPAKNMNTPPQNVNMHSEAAEFASTATEALAAPPPPPPAWIASPPSRPEAAAPPPASVPAPVPVPETPPLRASVAAAAPPTPAPAPAPAKPVGPAVDPSASLRREVQQVRREVDAAIADGPIPPGKRERLQKKIEAMRAIVQGYRGPDVAALRDFFQRTLGDVALGA
jgi:hypothetical protein